MTSEITRVFQIAFPPFLKTRYDFLQGELDKIINDPVFRPQIDQLDPDAFYLSEYYRELKRICQQIDQTDWKTGDYIINNPSWHWRILAENIRSTMSSLVLRRKIYSILEKYDFELTNGCQLELDELRKKSYFSSFVIENIQRSKSWPSMPTHIGFKLDYAFSSGQMFKMSDDYLCSFQNEDKTWTDVQLIVPGTIREEFTGRLSKPVFMKRSDGQYIGHARYCIKPKVNPNAKNILCVGYSAQEIYKTLTPEEQETADKALYALLEDLFQNEVAFTHQLYDKIDLADQVIDYVKYNGNRALQNLGREPYFKHGPINPIIENALNTSSKNHDFFSVKGDSYVVPVNVEEMTDDDWDF